MTGLMLATRPTSPKSSWCAPAEHDYATPADQNTLAILQRLAALAGIPTPQLQIIDDAYPAAFAFGGGPFQARIFISTGLRRLLTVEELTAVLAHEISHIKQHHSLLMIITNAIAATFVIVAGLIGLVGYSLRRQGGVFLTALGIAVVFAALVCRDAVVRHCEFEADRLGAFLCGHPEGLISALRKVSAALTLNGRGRNHRGPHRLVIAGVRAQRSRGFV